MTDGRAWRVRAYSSAPRQSTAKRKALSPIFAAGVAVQPVAIEQGRRVDQDRRHASVSGCSMKRTG